MTVMRCSRCSRLRDPGESNDAAAFITALAGDASADPSVFGGHAPWAAIDGADVCPQCQSVDERNASGYRIIAAVEAEIARLGTSGEGQTPAEAGLISYVMHLRERLAQTALKAAPPRCKFGHHRTSRRAGARRDEPRTGWPAGGCHRRLSHRPAATAAHR